MVYCDGGSAEAWREICSEKLPERGMPFQLLTTELEIPAPRPSLVRRPHLAERSGEERRPGGKLNLVPVPPGNGKTTLWREWIPCWGGGMGKEPSAYRSSCSRGVVDNVSSYSAMCHLLSV
jgi:hypothetical protein